MTAPQIPNLLDSLRASRSSRTGNGRRNDGITGLDQDRVVRQTDDDAAGSRLSAVELGYLDDPFAKIFTGSKALVRRMPIINRGTYVRTTAIDRLVQQFLDQSRNIQTQIISLGAGTDTRFFRLVQQNPSLVKTLHYHEIDFPSTTLNKIKAIEGSPMITSLLKSAFNDTRGLSVPQAPFEISAGGTSLTSRSYSIHGIDLRDLASPSPPPLPGISVTSPTLILSECCLTYLAPGASHDILSHFASTLLPAPTSLQIVLYEPLHPHDAFGRTMTSNLTARAIYMPSLEVYPTIEAHRNRLRNLGFIDCQEGWMVKEIWDTWISVEAKDSLRGLEMVDEEEEWILLAGHYGIVRAARNGSKSCKELEVC